MNPAVPSRRPNILIVIADDGSFGHSGSEGCRWVKTPNFDRLAKEGIVFSRAYTPNAKCAPSRAAILTGRNSWQLKEAANHGGTFPLEYRTFPEALAEAGYRCGLTGKGWGPGTALNGNGSPRALIGAAFDQARCSPATLEISDNDYGGNFRAFLDTVPNSRPWFFWLDALERALSRQA